MKAVIQAGGKGKRLMPYTTVLPKPLMPVGNEPVLILLLKWLRRNGTRDVFITTGHLGHLIQSVCGDGRQWDMQITYVEEPELLGTVGGLALIDEGLDDAFLVINGDVLTNLNLPAFSAFHRSHDAMLSIAVAQRQVHIDFGVIETDEGEITKFREKPVLSYKVSMGVYCMDPKVLDYIPKGVPFGIDNLVNCLMGKKLPIQTFVHDGTWLDIGRIEDFQKAQSEAWDEDVNPSEFVAA